MGELPDQNSGDITLLDMEASIEHLTRGTVRNVDVLLVITEPYYRSLETAGRMVPLAHELGLKRVWVVANKIRSERDEAAIREYCSRRDFELVGVVPFDENITEADHQGRSLIDYAPTSTAVVAIQSLADAVLGRAGTPPTVDA
ncbi:MAG TPA: hypothetical protein VGQ62_08610 [Chloroflexota bacterium]|jgi:CO dehydrogenase maturation factor|nr:hypothetical protein [Chloroflexota bacterium]